VIEAVIYLGAQAPDGHIDDVRVTIEIDVPDLGCDQ
jgi:hypothetical protein